MKKLIFTVFLTTAILVEASPKIEVDKIPLAGVFQNYGEFDWTGINLHKVDLDRFKEEAIIGSIPQIVQMANQSDCNRIVLFSNGSNDRKEFHIPGISTPLLLDTKNPKLIALWYKKSGRKSAFIPFVAVRPQATNGSIDFDTSMIENTANVNHSYWLYLNLSKLMKEAVDNNASSIYIESTEDTNYEEVWLPQLDTPIRISKKDPKLHAEIII